ncbi:hypothetical protein ACWGJX_03120 [Streptomyces sp. NPDC054775]
MPAPPGPSAGPRPPSAGTTGRDGGPGPDCTSRAHPRIHERRTEGPDGTDTFSRAPAQRRADDEHTAGTRLPFLAALLVGVTFSRRVVRAGAWRT